MSRLMTGEQETFAVEPSGRRDDYRWQVLRLSDGVVIGVYLSKESAERAAMAEGVKWLLRVEG